MYESTVGAQMPIISMLRDILQTGDVVCRVEGLLSATLSYVFTKYNGEVPFSEVVADAWVRGVTEPDPREDLAGADVARKVLTIARELGLRLELEEVEIQNLIPKSLGLGEFKSQEDSAPRSSLDGAAQKLIGAQGARCKHGGVRTPRA